MSSINEALVGLLAISAWLERAYKDFHARPELSSHETRTAAVAASKTQGGRVRSHRRNRSERPSSASSETATCRPCWHWLIPSMTAGSRAGNADIVAPGFVAGVPQSVRSPKRRRAWRHGGHGASHARVTSVVASTWSSRKRSNDRSAQRRATPGVNVASRSARATSRRLARTSRPSPVRSSSEFLVARQRGPRARRRSAFVTTDAELRLMASAAIMGESSQPVNG